MENFFESSSIHCFRYLSKKFHWIERFFWILSLLISLVITIILNVKLIEKFKSIPIIVQISDEQVPVIEIDFPAVTLCYGIVEEFPTIHRNNFDHVYFRYERNTNKIYPYEDEEFKEITNDERRFGFIRYTNILEKIENGEINVNELEMPTLKRLQVIDLIAKLGTFAKINFSIPTEDFLDVINEFEIRALPKVSIIKFFQTNSKFSILSNVLTENNICKSFNLAPTKDVFNINLTSDDFNYQHYDDENIKLDKNVTIIVPQRTSLTEVYLSTQMLSYALIRLRTATMTEGGVMFLHDPYELPTRYTQRRAINEHQNIEIFIEPHIMEVDESLYNEKPKGRNCYFDDEHELKLFKVYTKANCQLECMSELMITRCGCVEFFMIRNRKTRICSASEKHCFDKVRNEFDAHMGDCDCLERCDYVKYNYEITVQERTVKNLQELAIGRLMLTDISMMYRNDFVNKFIRKKHFNETDFLSYIGGLLGLFAGFSFLSTVEIFFWIIKIIFARRDTLVFAFNERQQELKKKFKVLTDFLENSSIHGMNYLSKSRLKQKIFWTFFITISLTLCGFMIKNIQKQTWTKSYDDSYGLNEKILFPAVTITPNRYVSVSIFKTIEFHCNLIALYKKTKVSYKKNMIEQFECFHLVEKFCFDYKKTKVFDMKLYKKHSKVKWLSEQYATWNNKYQVNFTEINTLYGPGFSFNLIEAEELLNFDKASHEFKYSRNISMSKNISMPQILSQDYPLRIDFKSHSKLTLKIKEEELNNKNMKICMGKSIMIHSPIELPLFEHDHKLKEIVHSTDIEILPEITKTEDSLRVLSPNERECYFEDERKLKYFKIYKQSYCTMECILDQIIEECKCLYPFFIYGSKHNDMNFCAKKEYDCVQNFQYLNYKDNDENNCTCLPTCNSLIYHLKYYPRDDENDSIVINIKMNTDELILYRRFQLFTFSDAVSYVGGLLGLFAGISMLSIVEIFYFFILRIFLNFLKSFK